MSLIKESVLALNEYRVTQHGARIKLNQNESPYTIPEELRVQIIDRLSKVSWNRYPSLDSAPLADAIAGYSQFPVSGISIGNGSNEMIQSIMLAACDTRDRVVVVTPGFSIYPRVAGVIGADLCSVPLDQDFHFDIPALIDASSNARLVIFSSPNNPTGTAIDVDMIEEIVRNVQGLLVVDEAYYEFSRVTARCLIKKYPNLVIIRTMSKAFSMAGLRLGYVLGQPEVIRAINRAKLPFSVDIFTQLAGEVLMENAGMVIKHVDEIINERERIFLELDIIRGVIPVPSSTNFILFELEDIDAREIYEALFNEGILVRVFNDERLKKFLRVTTGTPRENDIFLERIKSIIGRKRGEI